MVLSQKIDLENHVSINSVQLVNKICSPLYELFGVEFFRYLKLYKNGKRVILSNNPDAIRYMYTQGNWVNLWYDGNFSEFLKPGWYPWNLNKMFDEREVTEKIQDDLTSLLKVQHGVTLVREGKDYYEIFSFDTVLNTIYHADRALLLHFTYYFKEQARKLIQRAEADSVWLTAPAVPIKKETPEQVFTFLKDTKINRYYLSMGECGDTYLTAKEITCIRWMIAGKTAEEIAIIENNTTKTIQRHIENIKNKLNCQKQAQIVKLFIDAEI